MVSAYIPKVGDPCEIRSSCVKWRPAWIKAKLLFSTEQIFVFEHAASGNHFCVALGAVEIREPQEGSGDE